MNNGTPPAQSPSDLENERSTAAYRRGLLAGLGLCFCAVGLLALNSDSGDLNVQGDTNLEGTLAVAGSTTLNGTLSVPAGLTTLGGGLSVTGGSDTEPGFTADSFFACTCTAGYPHADTFMVPKSWVDSCLCNKYCAGIQAGGTNYYIFNSDGPQQIQCSNE